jgi:hypothetical protein
LVKTRSHRVASMVCWKKISQAVSVW